MSVPSARDDPPLPAPASAQLCGTPFVAVDVARPAVRARAEAAIVAGVAGGARVPELDAHDYDLLLTTAANAPRPWISLAPDALDGTLALLSAAAHRHPLASRVLAETLRASAHLSFADALRVESFAYSTLLGGSEFRAWRAVQPVRPAPVNAEPRLRIAREGELLTIRLCNPQRHNTYDAQLRDELLEALAVAAADPALQVELRADGKHFCSGGDLQEFGAATDLALAHAIRTQYSVAASVHRLRDRFTSHVHGACIGAGIEIPAAARIVATADACFRLPELAMGLIPGAGGTATLPRRIGRHRCLYWALLDASLDLRCALDWGLVDVAGAGS